MSRKERVQVLLSEQERERFRRHAREGDTSLSSWLRRAGLERARELERRSRLDSVAALEAFFAECDGIEEPREPEPDWEQVRRLIADSRGRGLPDE